jgi:hypothetical protein
MTVGRSSSPSPKPPTAASGHRLSTWLLFAQVGKGGFLVHGKKQLGLMQGQQKVVGIDRSSAVGGESEGG